MDLNLNNLLNSLEGKIKFFSVPSSIPLEKRDELIGYFADVLTTPEALEPVHTALHAYFSGNNFDNKLIKEYYFTFWRWYVEASFLRFSTLSFDDCSLIFSKQFCAAFQLNIKVEESLFYYFFRKFSDEDKLREFYQKLKLSIVQSQTLVHPYVDKSPKLLDVVTQYAKLKNTSADSITMADYAASIQRVLFPQGQSYENFEESKKTEITKSFLEFTYFFSQEKDIIPIINNYIDTIIPVEKEKKSSTLDAAPSELLNSNSEISTPASPVTIENPAPMSPAEIQSRVDAQFEKDENGQYKDLEGVFAALDEIASTYNDESIRELFYFDEQSGGFKWREG